MNITFLSLWEKSSHANLGILYLSSYIKKYGENVGKVNFLENENFSLNDLKKTKPDVVGLTSVTPSLNKIKEASQIIRQELDIPILIGGPHITSLPQSLPEFIDIGFIGEAEETLTELFNKKFEDLNNVKGIVYFDNKKRKINPRRELIEPLDKIPFPDRDLLDPSYFEPSDILTIHEKLIGTNITTSRGCPYNCIYCQSRALWPKARFYSAKYVADEIIMLREKYKVKALAIDDDLFVAQKERVNEIVKHLDEAGILGEIKFNCTGRANLINDEVLQSLKKMGVIQVNMGIESNSERILKYLKKDSVTVEQNQNAVDMIHKYGMQVYCSFMLGTPGETKEDMIKTLEFYKRNDIETATLNITTPLPGTALWIWAKENGLVKDDMDWDAFFNSLYKPETQLYINEIVPRNEFMKLYKEFQQEIFKRTALSWKGLSIKDAIKSAIKQPRKSFKFLLSNFKDIPRMFKNED